MKGEDDVDHDIGTTRIDLSVPNTIVLRKR